MHLLWEIYFNAFIKRPEGDYPNNIQAQDIMNILGEEQAHVEHILISRSSTDAY